MIRHAIMGRDSDLLCLSGLNKEEKLAKAVSSREGEFVFDFATDHDGPVLLTASGGIYRDLATNEIAAIKPEQEHSATWKLFFCG